MSIKSIYGKLLDWTGLANVPAALKALAGLKGTVGQIIEISGTDAEGVVSGLTAVNKPTGDGVTVPTKVSELTNDSGYQTEAQVNALLAAFPSFEIQVVSELPTTGADKTIYLVPFAAEDGQYLEYLYVDGAWEVVGNGAGSGANVTLTSPDGSVWKLAVTNEGAVYASKQSESGGGESEEPDVVTYTVTNALTNAVTSNDAETVEGGAEYTAIVAAASEDYTLSSVIVTMGGVDITAEVYADGTIIIPEVTGDIVITVVAVVPAEPTDIMSQFKYIGPTTYSPGTYTAWCPTGLIYDETRDVYAHFMNVQNRHYQAPNACELWFNAINPETLAHTKPVFIARTGEALSGSMVSAGALGNCIKDGIYYMFSNAEKGYYKSEDGGITWTHEEYEAGPDQNPWGCYVLDNGRMIMGADTQTHKVYYSDDNGKNWTTVQSENFNEPTFIDFGGGSVMAICRENMDADNNIQKPWMHVSRNYGATWTDSVAMETVGYMGNNNCNAYVHDNYVELFVGCRIPTASPQHTDDVLYRINQYVMPLSSGPVDGFEFVNTVYEYKNDDNPQGLTTSFTGADDFSTPVIAIKDKSHALMMFYAPGSECITHHLIAVGNIPVDSMAIPSIIPDDYTASQSFSGTHTDTTITVCDSYGINTDGNWPSLRDGGYLLLDDIVDGGFAHLQMVSSGFTDASGYYLTPAFASVVDGNVMSASCYSGLGLTPMPSGATTLRYASIKRDDRAYPASGALIDMYAFADGDLWWVYSNGTWVRMAQGGIPVDGITWSNNTTSSPLNPYHYQGLTTYRAFSTVSSNHNNIALIEYDKAA